MENEGLVEEDGQEPGVGCPQEVNLELRGLAFRYHISDMTVLLGLCVVPLLRNTSTKALKSGDENKKARRKWCQRVKTVVILQKSGHVSRNPSKNQPSEIPIPVSVHHSLSPCSPKIIKPVYRDAIPSTI